VRRPAPEDIDPPHPGRCRKTRAIRRAPTEEREQQKLASTDLAQI
jgi:hypothetical protein